MYMLHTKDPKRRTNALLFHVSAGQMYCVESDVGQRLRMTLPELVDRYDIGRPIGYWAWNQQRRQFLEDRPTLEAEQAIP